MNIVKQNQMKLSITKLSSHNVSVQFLYFFRKIFHQQVKKYFIVQLLVIPIIIQYHQ